MKSAYHEECGYPVEDNSALLKDYEIVASELYALSCYGDYIYKQAFVQSATGENLDRLGELRCCTRKTASRAQGVLTFTVGEVLSEDIVIPVGTVCSVSEKPFIQFATTEQGVITAGQSEVSVGAQALGDGDEYNVKPNKVNVMVNAPLGVIGVTNAEKFDGGYNQESDSHYRKRILNNYLIVQNGVNAASYENVVLLLDFVTDCHIAPASETQCMRIYVSTKSNTLTKDDKWIIQNQIPFLVATGIKAEILLAQTKPVELKVDMIVKRGFNADEISERLEQIVWDVFSALRIGESIELNTLRKELIKIDGIASYSFYSEDIIGDVIRSCNDVLTLGELTVNYIYE